MHNVEEKSPSGDSPVTPSVDLKVWQRPEAKVADVAAVTLAGSSHRNTADLGTCAS
jgi:hypothetical protein